MFLCVITLVSYQLQIVVGYLRFVIYPYFDLIIILCVINLYKIRDE